MKKSFFFSLACALFLLCSIGATAQTVVNNYASVDSITLSSGHSVVMVDSASGFSVGDEVLIIQMKGASIDTADSSTFGRIISYKNAGNYEFSTISGISGNTITLCSVLSRNYTTSGHVQLVKVFVPTLDGSRNYTVSSALTAKQWNGSKGGVFVMETPGKIILNASIDVTGKGFRGGRVSPNYQDITNTWGTSEWRFWLSLDTNYSGLQGGEKGEGIADLIYHMEAGRGRQTNGGGGGNGHNCGGGGGGNGGAGGRGGSEIGDSLNAKNGGVGGCTLIDSVYTRLFLGGAGGGAHQNNGVGTSGANGGGLIIIKANAISSSGSYGIIANGDSSKTFYGVPSDGVGGGGAGGTVVLDINTYSNSVPVSVFGGKGGNNIYLYNDAFTAAGGGGGGGTIYYSGGSHSHSFSPSLNGGKNGYSVNGFYDTAFAGTFPGQSGFIDSMTSLSGHCNLSILKGIVSTSTGKALKNSWVYLLVYHSSDSTFSAVDSMKTDTLGDYQFTTSDTLVFLVAYPDSTLYPTQLPTYYDSSVVFIDSKPISLGTGTVTINFSTLAGTNPGGQGFIGGKINTCTACKKGGPAVNLKVILTDANNKPLAVTYTDANGNFRFKGLAIQKYKIFMDKPTINNALAPKLLLTSALPDLSNLLFVLYPDYLEQVNTTTGINQTIANNGEFKIYPNPASGEVNIILPNTGESKIDIHDMLGHSVFSNLYNADNGMISINIQNLPKGIYFISITQNNVQQKVSKLVVE